MSLDRDAVKKFEAELDRALDALTIYQYDANACLTLAANLLETAALERARPIFHPFADGLNILAARFVNGRQGCSLWTELSARAAQWNERISTQQTMESASSRRAQAIRYGRRPT